MSVETVSACPVIRKGPVDVISKEELAAHATRASAWISIKGRVYDVSEFVRVHPGGDVILTAAGRDATDVFAAFHAGTTSWRLLPPLCIGLLQGGEACVEARIGSEEEIVRARAFRAREEGRQANGVDVDMNAGAEEQAGVLKREAKLCESAASCGGCERCNICYERDVREMRRELVRRRMFESWKSFYLYKILANLLFLVASIVLVAWVGGWACVIVGALLLALFWQQCGWLAHDFLHHQVFEHRSLNNAAGILVGNVWQGFSVSWWKSKHNHHHAVPNVTETIAGGDPDIHTAPLLHWSEKLINGEDLGKLPKVLLKYQWFLYWPILCMARTSWLIQSVLYQLDPRNRHVTSDTLYIFELIGLTLHYVWYFYLLTFIPAWDQTLVFFFLSQGLGGLFIGIVFTVGHNAMDVLTHKEMFESDFVRLQLRTTRNVTPSLFNDWFTGGLNYQVEHHIWPTLPRHSLPVAAEILKAFCEKHDIQYSCEGLIEGNARVCRLLARLSATV